MDAVSRKVFCKPSLKWKCPPQIALNPVWSVAAGEESEEAKSQTQREIQFPETIYIRRSYIPSNPFFPKNVQEDELDDSRIPLIRMTPIEDDAEPHEENDSSFGGTKVLLPSSLPAVSQCEAQNQIKPYTVSLPAVEAGSSSTHADVALAAATAATALLKSNESGSCIDTDLLVKIFSDPNTVNRLLREVGSSSISETKPVIEKKLSKASLSVPNSKSVSVEKVYSEHGSLKKSVGTSLPNSITEPKRHTDESGVAGNKRKVPFSEVKYELAPSIKGVIPVPRPDSVASNFTFLSQAEMLVHKSTSLPIMPMGTPQPSLPTSKSDLDEFKWTNTGYGVPNETNIESIASKYLFSPKVTIPTPNEGLLLPTMFNINPLPSRFSTDIKLKAVSSDSLRPTDSQLMSALPGAPRVDPYLFPNQAQTALQMKAPLLYQGPPNFEMYQPFPNPLQSGAQMMGLAAVNTPPLPFLAKAGPNAQLPPFLPKAGPNAPPLSFLAKTGPNAHPPPFLPKAGPQLHDKNYLRALIQEHGEVRQDRDNSLRFHQQNTKPEPYLDSNVLTMKIQRPCGLFNSPDGCNFGYGCPYLHVLSSQNMQLSNVLGTNSSKRVKLDADVSGVHMY